MEKVLLLTIEEDTQEMHSLLETLGVSVVKEFLQNRPFPHKVGFLGPGKLKEIEEANKDLKYDAIVINGLLKPSQHHYLEMRFQIECIDRTGVILRIFADHAHTPEAIAQVTLAKLRYELPFLREWIHKAKKGDRPGFLAGGGYATDVYFEHAKTHARRIEKNLEELSRQRGITRIKRHAKGYSLVSLAGYTNAGKSALFNQLCGAEVIVDDRLFSTLSTTTRRVLGIHGNVLMADTVGFIKDLPPNLIDAFNSTLEEIFFADLILLVFDASEPIESVKSKLRTSIGILLPKIESQTLVMIANKIDLLSESKRARMSSEVLPLAKPYQLLSVSAITEEGIGFLRDFIASIQRRSLVIEVRLPLSDDVFSLLSRLHSTCSVTQNIVGDTISATIRCKEEDAQKVTGWLNKAGAIKMLIHTENADTTTSQGSRASSGNEGAPLI